MLFQILLDSMRHFPLLVFSFLFFLAQIHSTEQAKIPLTLHWVHLSSDRLTDEEIQSIQSWRKLHPKWTFKLWTMGPCSLKRVSLCPIDPAFKDLDALKRSILQKEGGVFLDLALIGCKRLDPLIYLYESFESADGRSVIGCAPGRFDAPRERLSEAFILPDQIFVTDIPPSPETGVCFWKFKDLPSLTEELRKIHTAEIKNENNKKTLMRQVCKTKQYSLSLLALACLNCLLIANLLPCAIAFWNRHQRICTSSALVTVSLVFAGNWLLIQKPSIPDPKLGDFVSFSEFEAWKSPLAKEDQRRLDLYGDLFSQYMQSKQISDTATIPHTIHFIWGGKPFPETSIPNILSWMRHHPEWTFKFWTDDPNRPIPVKGMEKHLFAEILPSSNRYMADSKNWGEKSDYLRCEILNQEGGLYVDHDVECRHCFEDLHRSVSFYASMEPIHQNPVEGSCVIISNCLVGASPGHPILTFVKQETERRWDLAAKIFPDHDQISSLLRTLYRTFGAFDKAVGSLASANSLILPPAWVFPKYCSPKLEEKIRNMNVPYANHNWNGTWYKALPTVVPPEIPEQLAHKISANFKLFRRLFGGTLFSFFLLSATSLFQRARLKNRSIYLGI